MDNQQKDENISQLYLGFHPDDWWHIKDDESKKSMDFSDSKKRDGVLKHLNPVSSPVNGFDNSQLRGNTYCSDELEGSDKGTENSFVNKNNPNTSCDSVESLQLKNVELLQQEDPHKQSMANVESTDKKSTDAMFRTSEPNEDKACDKDVCNSSSNGQKKSCQSEQDQNHDLNSAESDCTVKEYRDGSREELSVKEQSYNNENSSHSDPVNISRAHLEKGLVKIEYHTVETKGLNQNTDSLSCVETGEKISRQKDDIPCLEVKVKSDQGKERSGNFNIGTKIPSDTENNVPESEEIKCESGKPNRNDGNTSLPDCVGPTDKNVEDCHEVKPGKEKSNNRCKDSCGVRESKDLDVAKQVEENDDHTPETPSLQNSSQFVSHVSHRSNKTCGSDVSACNLSNVTEVTCSSTQKLKTDDTLPHIPELMKSGLLKDLTISVIPSEKNKEPLKSTPVKLLEEKLKEKPQENPLPPFLETICGNIVTDEMVENILKVAKFPDFFKGEVTIGKFIPVKFPDNYNFRLHEDETLLECPSMVTPLLLKKKDKFPLKYGGGNEKVEDETVRNKKDTKTETGKVIESSKNLLKFSMGSEKFEKMEEGFKNKGKESIKTTVGTDRRENKTGEMKEDLEKAQKISVNAEEGKKNDAKKLPITSLADDENRKVITEINEKDSKKTKESSNASLQNNSKVQEDRKEFLTNTAIGYLTAIGLSRVQEWHHKDLMRSKERHMRRAGKTKQLENEVAIIKAAYLQAKKANEAFVFKSHKCGFCNFKSESIIVMDGHDLVPYVTPRREFGCHLCEFYTRDPKAILFHMEAEHRKMGRLPVPSQFHECPFCPFDTNHKQKLNSHINRCQKFFILGKNQSTELDMPAQTVKPITIMDIKAYMYERQLMELAAATRRPGHPPGSRGGHRTQINVPRPRANVSRPFIPSDMLPYNRPLYQHLADSVTLQSRMPMSSYPRSTNVVAINQIPQSARSSLFRQVPHAVPTNHIYHVVGSGNAVPVFNSSGQASSCRSVSQMSNVSEPAPQPVALFTNVAVSTGGTSASAVNKKSLLKAELSPPPKLQGPFLPNSGKSAPGETILPSNSFVICEICDGYIKDQEQLRNHMQMIHKVKIHPKMLQNRPPLNCQKCQWRFFTDQGLERHLLGSHGLVTSNMQELAQRSQDGGRCTICGRVYVCKLVAHMNQVHKIMLKPAHLSYKCTVCTATFNLYKLFENHVYVVHSGSVKRRAEDGSSNQPSKKRAGDRSTKTVTSKANPRLKSKKATPSVRMGAGNGKSKVSAASGEAPNGKERKCGDCGIETSGCRRSPRRRKVPTE
ncbi:uncharacterized protein LOC106463965 isoform X1 [Limulus polyphemus]|uniref:Uncharacterized protein LOC106463965 isoform X1 n=1 Tax=Limulus polyphemus TaxID=6850 RepID=A0ABM1BD10_LIMPO|nr:uncharacterized protein LOC106463965 isoform X1 [Limulus polyphemus]XP_022247321.1 uncharacterized protein LOC106463965 isoform X1 [Limulus polyphemus]XP_022247322.1 uncharacterized protein LOC106463965 isoform X1 [Limulus polyphemus]XP_022247323.1 uncharacterized protein LOC106463965 isoform X1 [Limulus polyphemus]XP_022247324.1 uncharacterized protein LOC106463965 isoform X1 [Limulus polyphemus]XP_022247325.1 uncharacterized protein LOC106463965 isoform X1 [Limulus polyphemus]